MDSLLNELSKSNVGCHIGWLLASGFGYADHPKLLTPSVHALRILANICEMYAAKYDITVNIFWLTLNMPIHMLEILYSFLQ